MRLDGVFSQHHSLLGLIVVLWRMSWRHRCMRMCVRFMHAMLHGANSAPQARSYKLVIITGRVRLVTTAIIIVVRAPIGWLFYVTVCLEFIDRKIILNRMTVWFLIDPPKTFSNDVWEEDPMSQSPSNKYSPNYNFIIFQSLRIALFLLAPVIACTHTHKNASKTRASC